MNYGNIFPISVVAGDVIVGVCSVTIYFSEVLMVLENIIIRSREETILFGCKKNLSFSVKVEPHSQ